MAILHRLVRVLNIASTCLWFVYRWMILSVILTMCYM